MHVNPLHDAEFSLRKFQLFIADALVKYSLLRNQNNNSIRPLKDSDD